MQKIYTTVAFLLLFAASSSAQFYLHARAGYAFKTANERVAGLRKITNLDASMDDGIRLYVGTAQGQNMAENLYGTGGEGITGGIAAGYFFNKYIGAELGVEYFSSKISLVQQTTSISGSFRIDAEFRANSNQIRVLPSIIVRGGDEGIQPYARFGLLAPIFGQVDIENKSSFNNGYGLTTFDNGEQTLNQTNNIVFNGAFSLGYNSAIGINIPLAPHINLTAEAELLTLGIRGGKSTVVSSKGETTDNKTNALVKTTDDLASGGFETVYLQQTEYVDVLTADSNVQAAGYNYDPDKPKNELRRISSYTSIGVFIGLRYQF